MQISAIVCLPEVSMQLTQFTDDFECLIIRTPNRIVTGATGSQVFYYQNGITRIGVMPPVVKLGSDEWTFCGKLAVEPDFSRIGALLPN